MFIAAHSLIKQSYQINEKIIKMLLSTNSHYHACIFQNKSTIIPVLLSIPFIVRHYKNIQNMKK